MAGQYNFQKLLFILIIFLFKANNLKNSINFIFDITNNMQEGIFENKINKIVTKIKKKNFFCLFLIKKTW